MMFYPLSEIYKPASAIGRLWLGDKTHLVGVNNHGHVCCKSGGWDLGIELEISIENGYTMITCRILEMFSRFVNGDYGSFERFRGDFY